MTKSFAAKLKKIKILVTDVDGVLTDGGMYYSMNGLDMKKFNVHDGMGLVLLQNAGFKVAMITSETSEIVTRRAAKLNITEVYQGVKDKVAVMESLLAKYSLRWDEVAYIGDDVNDLGVLERAGFAATPADGVKKNKAAADYIAKNNGGDGCVRELCDMLLERSEKTHRA